MSLTLGIDTGGTFTDIVVWDTVKKRVLRKAKAFTTHHDLTIGINECLRGLDQAMLETLSAVHLSTTLTVNAILEDRLSKVGLIVIGAHLPKKLPIAEKYELVRYHYRSSQNQFAIDNGTSQHIAQLFNETCPIVMVSACGTSYCDLEIAAAMGFRERLRSQVICCSSISLEPDFYQRTLNAVTTMGLKPIITQWIASMENTIRQHDIKAPIKILTNTGDLLSLNQAAKNPLATMMSGPAASFMGSQCLTQEKDYLLLDMGGTSLDITKVTNRNTRFSKADTPVGRYAFHIHTLDLQSFGTGGDSQIKLDALGNLTVGPQKVTPLCVLGSKYPYLANELDKYRLPEDYDLCTASESDCFFINQNVSAFMLRKEEKRIIDLLTERAHSLFFLADYFDTDADALHLDTLVEKGYVARASLTPTDILHAEGSFQRWDAGISKVGLSLLAERTQCGPDAFIKKVKERVTNQLVFFCMQSIAGFEQKSFRFSDSKATMYLIEKYLHDKQGITRSDFSIQKPIVGLGAPAKAWLPAVAKKLHARLLLPDDGDVACAIGAAAGKEKR